MVGAGLGTANMKSFCFEWQIAGANRRMHQGYPPRDGTISGGHTVKSFFQAGLAISPASSPSPSQQPKTFG